MSLEHRIERLRTLMDARGYDAVILRNNGDLRWLTGAEQVFDGELAHTAFITGDGLWLHTDSRYYHAFCDRMGADSPWHLDMDAIGGPAWAAERVRETRARMVAVEDSMSLGFHDAFEQALNAGSMACLTPRLHDDLMCMRAVKEPEELDAMRAAQAISDEAFTHMCEYIKAGMTELEIRAELEGYMLSHGADGLAFDSIVASGPNAANPHAIPSSRVVEPGDVVLMDFGAAKSDYRSDMTRTVVVGEPTDELRQSYELVRESLERANDAVAPGIPGSDIHDLAYNIICEKCPEGVFGYSVGHGVGLDIHELPHLGRIYHDILEPGEAITIEPGIYMPGAYGIRIEDFGAVSETGFDSFTASTHDLVIVGQK